MLPKFWAAHISCHNKTTDTGVLQLYLCMLSAHELLLSCWVSCFNLELPGNPPHCVTSIFPSQCKWSFQIEKHTRRWPVLQKLSWDVKHGCLMVIQAGWQRRREGGWHKEYLERWVCCLHVCSVSCPSPLSSVSVIHRGALLPTPASHLTTTFEKQVFSEETAYYVLFCDDTFMSVQISGGKQFQLSVLCQNFLIEVGFHVTDENQRHSLCLSLSYS